MRAAVNKFILTGLVVGAGLVGLGCEHSKPVGPQGADLGPAFNGTHPPSLPSGVQIAGLGTLTTGGGTQSFDFDVRDDLTGRVFYTDSRFGATLIVDGDPLTKISAFRDGSARCADRTRGAEFDATGRRESGSYEAFTVVACDNGAAESGADFFRISTALQYVNEGFLASGDIVKGEPAGDPTTGDLRVTNSTSGTAEDLDADGYTVTVATGTTSQTGTMPTNGEIVFGAIAAGDYTVTLEPASVAGNCAVTSANPQTATVSAGGTTTTTFTLACGPDVSQDARIAGIGTLTTGGGTQSLDFDVAQDLTGRLFYDDSRFSASITVDADPLTEITAFRDGSARCADPTRGAEFDGVGRVSRPTGTSYEIFTVAACDNGAGGSGTDFFRVSTGTGYVNEGLLASGDVVKTQASP